MEVEGKGLVAAQQFPVRLPTGEVEPGRRRVFGSLGAGVGRHGQDRFLASDLTAIEASSLPAFGTDLFDQAPNAVRHLLGRKPLPAPAGQGLQVDRLRLGEVEAGELSSAPPGGSLLAAIEPISPQTAISTQGRRAVDTGPIPWIFDQVLLDAVTKDVAQASDLGRLLVADDDRVVASLPERSPPFESGIHLFREIGVHVGHEIGDLAGIPGP